MQPNPQVFVHAPGYQLPHDTRADNNETALALSKLRAKQAREGISGLAAGEEVGND